MFPCPFCNSQLSSEVAFTSHIKLKHKTLMTSTCYCPYENCFRSFNNCYTYKKHLSLKHSIHVDGTQEIENELNDKILVEFDDSQASSSSQNRLTHKSCANETSLPFQSGLSVDSFSRIVDEHIALFVAQLYADPTLPRSFVPSLIDKLNNLYNLTFISMLKQKYKCDKCECKELPSDLDSMFYIVQHAFDNFSTEHKTLKYFDNLNILIKPQSIIVGASLKSRFVDGRRQVVVSNTEIQVIPIKLVLKKFLELPNVLTSILSHLEYCKKSEPIISAVQGEVWKNIEKKFSNKIVLPIILYFDDLEINNPLGSHRNVHKLGAVYFSIACLPFEYSSMLENIFLAQLHNSVDYKSIGNKKIFSNIINQMIELEKDGLILNVNNQQRTVYFALLAIIGDNLGVNYITNFSTSFNSKYWCRICLADKVKTQNQVKEDSEMLRTIENYREDCAKCLRGVNAECVFNEIPSFHVIENASLDIMHDIFEGICRYEVPKMLKIFIIDEKIFSLDILNSRIKHFDYGTSVEKNVPLCIPDNILTTQLLIISSSEMLFLVENLGLLIGDLVPLDHKVWELYLNLREIISIILASSFNIATLQLLETLISEHHSLYLELFSETLKPKHHLLLHYARMMKRFGPLKYFSCIRYEAKHKQLKDNSKVITSRKKPAFTLALKHQLNMSYRFLLKKGFSNRLYCGPVLDKNLSSLRDYSHLKNILPPHIVNESISTSWVKVNGITYHINAIIIVDSNDLTFGQIKYIIIHESQNICFLYHRLITLGMHRHYYAFEVTETNTWGFISFEDINKYSPTKLYIMADGKRYISCM